MPKVPCKLSKATNGGSITLPRRSPRKHPTDQTSGSRSPSPTTPEYQPTDHARSYLLDPDLNAPCDQPQNIENEAGWVHKQAAAE